MAEIIGRYEILEKIDNGRLGEVFRARDQVTGHTRAIRRLPAMASETEAQVLFHAHRWGRLAHPNVVALYEAGKMGGQLLLAVELVEGPSVAALLQERRPLPHKSAFAMIYQIAQALDYAHSHGVIHGGIRPSNLLTRVGDFVAITDFRIAGLVLEEPRRLEWLLESVPYTSPEGLRGSAPDVLSDLFSFAACAFEMLSGERPLEYSSPNEIAHRGENEHPHESLNLEQNGFSPRRWHEVFAQALAKDPSERFTTAGQFAESLTDVMTAAARKTLIEEMKLRPDAKEASVKIGGVGYGDPPGSSSDVFISYGRNDWHRAQQLARILEAEGLSVWWDRKVPPGETFDRAIQKALDRASCIVVLWSTTSVESSLVRDLAWIGLRRKILVPILMDDVAVPLGFGRIQTANLVEWTGDDSHPELLRLKESIERLLRRDDTIDSSPAANAREPARGAKRPTLTQPGSAGSRFDPSLPRARTEPRRGPPLVSFGSPPRDREEAKVTPAPSTTSGPPPPGVDADAAYHEEASLILRGPKEAPAGSGMTVPRPTMRERHSMPRGGLNLIRRVVGGATAAVGAMIALPVEAVRGLLGWIAQQGVLGRPLGNAPVHEPDGPWLVGTPDLDPVETSVFAPAAARAGEHFLVQAFVHLLEQAEQTVKIATLFDRTATRRGFRTLARGVARGTTLTFDLAMPGLHVDDPVQSLVWTGRPESVQFGVRVPEELTGSTVVVGTVTVSLDSVPFGHVKFKLDLDVAPTRHRSEHSLCEAHHYGAVFISYASEDRAKILARVQMLESLNIQYFHDILSLDPGERWERALYKHIDGCDLFLLFWSTAAKQSEWVMKEVRYAMARKGNDELAPPEIKPVIIEGPPPVPPTPELAHLHFNDRLIYFMSPSAK